MTEKNIRYFYGGKCLPKVTGSKTSFFLRGKKLLALLLVFAAAAVTHTFAEPAPSGSVNVSAGNSQVPAIMRKGDPLVITVDKALEMALSENLSLQAERYSVSVKKRSRDNRWNAFAPDLGLSSTMAKSNEAPVIGEHHWNLSWQFSAQLALSASLVDGIRYLSQDYATGLISYEQAKSGLVRDVKKSFYSLLVLEESLKLLESNIQTAEKSYNQADINFRNGLVSEIDRLQAQVTLESLKPEYAEAQNSYRAALLSFKEILGLEVEDRVVLEGAIAPALIDADADQLVFLSLTDRLDIRLIVQQIKMLETDLSSSKNSRLPSLILGYSKNMVFADDPLKDKIIGAPDESWRDTGAFSITFSLDIDSLIPGLSTDTAIKNKQERIRQAEKQLSQSLRRADIEVRTIVMNMEKSVKKIESLRYSENLARRSYELASEGYNSGTIELLTLEKSRNQLQEVLLKIAQEKYNYQASLLDLEYALNKSLEEL